MFTIYLPNGMLSRVELGHKQIQGIDYAYTMQGWLKDINGYRSLFSDVYDLATGYDIGNDGFPVVGNPNSVFAWDAFSSSIQYYQADYQPIFGTNYFNNPSTSAVSLYNGNISALTTSYPNYTNIVLLKLFRYDKLNRIKQMQTAEQPHYATEWEPVSDNYSTEYSYDMNGNLLSLRRKDNSGQLMHDITYHYLDNTRNRLSSITATGLLSSSYQYDALGNLVRDNAENLTVGWNAMGKVDTIRRSGNILSTFRYSPTGQRQVKTDSSGKTLFYIHDATGNVMCVYQLKSDTLMASERYIYGSKRLGMLGQQVWITANGVAGMHDTSTIGVRTYELTDHLGNVTATILDRKRLNQNSYGNMVYIPFIATCTDYYPFGYPISERSSDMGRYRYFFNGQEADNEVLGDGALHAFEYRMHDTRIGRFWSVDPLARRFPWNSAYAFAENRVVDGRELEGLEVVFSTEEFTSAGGIAQYGWNFVRGKGRAYDALGITFFHYYSTFIISDKESVAGLLPAGIKKHYGIDFSAKSFSQAISNGSITSLDLAPFCRGSVEARDQDWYFGASVGLGIGAVYTTTETKIKSSYSITYEEQTRLRKLIKNKGFEYDDLNPDFDVYQVNGKNYLKYTQHGDWLHPFRKFEIKTSIKMNNVGTPANPQWESEEYQQKVKNGNP